MTPFQFAVHVLMPLRRNPVLRRLIDHRASRIRYGVAKGMLRRGGMGILGLLKKETPETRFLKGLDLAGATVFDIGANFGAFTLFFSRAVGAKGTVHAFEPMPINYRVLCDNIALNKLGNVVTHNVAAGSAAGEMELAYDPLDGATSTLSDTIQKSMAQAALTRSTVKVVTIDELVAEGAVPPPWFVKIDVEGFEEEVLKGMAETIRKHRPQLYIEIHPAAVDGEEIARHLTGLGYACRSVEKNSEITDDCMELTKSGHIYGAGTA